jgi:predicted DCC family thiol-disulfide oxidoreductase YuxK
MFAENSGYLLLNLGTPHERLMRRSDVTVHVLLLLGRGWRLLGQLLGVIPRWFRDWAYMLVARRRFHIGGRYDSCPLPSAAERAKFVGL